MCGTIRQVLWRLFAHCESRGYIPRGANPFTDTERFNGPHENAIEVWTPEEMTKLLAGAARDFLPCLAIGGFAGLRTSEILALDCRDVRLPERTIKVSHRKARCAGTRLAHWARTLAAEAQVAELAALVADASGRRLDRGWLQEMFAAPQRRPPCDADGSGQRQRLWRLCAEPVSVGLGGSAGAGGGAAGPEGSGGRV
jgi:integrase